MHRKKSKTQEAKVDDTRVTLPFDLDWYEANKSEIAVIMGFFFLRYLNLVYRKFDGDFVLCLVLGEIANHNISAFFSENGSCIEFISQLTAYKERMKRLKPTNAHSISEATGIPRETVRRKIEKLLKKGWIVKNDQGGLIISETVSDHFTKEFNKKILTVLFEASDCIRRL